jgi:hypothetical protein
MQVLNRTLLHISENWLSREEISERLPFGNFFFRGTTDKTKRVSFLS